MVEDLRIKKYVTRLVDFWLQFFPIFFLENLRHKGFFAHEKVLGLKQSKLGRGLLGIWH